MTIKQLSIMEESLENILEEVTTTLHSLEIEDVSYLKAEVLASAFLYLKQNPESTVENALDYGYNEWIK